MRTVKIVENFDGYPQGAKEGSKPQTFTAGQEVEVSNDFADLIIKKGHAKELDQPQQASEPTATTTKTNRESTSETRRHRG